MNSDNWWYIVFMLLIVTNNGNDIFRLLSSANFEEDFNKIISNIKEIDSEHFKDQCVEMILDKKSVFFDMNKAYRDKMMNYCCIPDHREKR